MNEKHKQSRLRVVKSVFNNWKIHNTFNFLLKIFPIDYLFIIVMIMSIQLAQITSMLVTWNSNAKPTLSRLYISRLDR